MSEESIIFLAGNSIRVVETLDHQRQINNCIYELGKLVSVTFDERTQKIKEYKVEQN